MALDIDGTLVNSRDELTDATREALLRARSAGIEIVLATGRRYSRALPLVEPLELNVPLVTASGALVKRAQDHQTIFCADFAPGVVERCLGLITASGYEAVVYADTFEQGFDYYCSSRNARREELIEFLHLNDGSGRIWPDLLTAPPPGIFSLFSMASRDEMLKLAIHLENQLPGELSVHVLRSPRYRGFMCEIAPHGISKWSAIERLAAGWGISDDEICAVGDDVNDIPMIQAAGLGIAMGNALDVVKKSADRVAPPHDEDGLVTVVDWLLADRGLGLNGGGRSDTVN